MQSPAPVPFPREKPLCPPLGGSSGGGRGGRSGEARGGRDLRIPVNRKKERR
jgi:hypothetical protein